MIHAVTTDHIQQQLQQQQRNKCKCFTTLTKQHADTNFSIYIYHIVRYTGPFLPGPFFPGQFFLGPFLPDRFYLEHFFLDPAERNVCLNLVCTLGGQ